MTNQGAGSNHDDGVHAIVAGLLRRGGRGLLVHRTPARRWYPDCWDLPGGHVEEGETAEMALGRELHEELGVDAVVTGDAFAQVRGKDFRMDIWVIDKWNGEPTNVDLIEHDALAWLNHDETAALRLAHPQLSTLLDAALR